MKQFRINSGRCSSLIGIIPAAGNGTRLGALSSAKELLPIEFRATAFNSGLQPRLAIEHSLQAVGTAGAANCVVVISPAKLEIVRYLLSGGAWHTDVLYAVQDGIRGLPGAILAALRATRFAWHHSAYCLSLPDTVYGPSDAIKKIYTTLTDKNADLVLGVFPVSRPEDLGPVYFDGEGRVLRIEDKPSHPTACNTWGVTAWSQRFTNYMLDICASFGDQNGEVVFGHIIQRGIDDGLHVVAEYFVDGYFFDVGTVAGIEEFIRHQLNPDRDVLTDATI